MADPVTLGMTAIGGATLLSAFGQYQAGEAYEAAGDYNARILDYNARVLEGHAEAARQSAAFEEVKQRREARRLKAAQRARYAKGGVVMTEGTPLRVLTETAAEAELDALAIRYAGEVKAKGYEAQAHISEMEADVSRWEGKQRKRAARLGAGRTILSGIGDIALLKAL